MEEENAFQNKKHRINLKNHFKEPIKVLHVDDEQVCLKMTKYYLEEMGGGEIMVDSLLSPEQVDVNMIVSGKLVLFEIKSAKSDVGKVVGRRGQNIFALRSIVGVVGAKNNVRINIEVLQ